MTRSMILIFCAAYIGLSLVFELLGAAFGFAIPSDGIISAFVAAQICGFRFGGLTGRRPGFGESNFYTGLFTLCLLVMTLGQLALNPAMFAQLGDPAMQAVVGLILLISAAAIRIFFPLGARQGVRNRAQGD